MLLSFEARDEPPGVEVVDHIERRQCKLHTPDPVTPREAPLDEFYFPVDRGVSITTDRLSLPHTAAAYVRNHAGWMIAELNEGDSREFPADVYSVEITAPIKLYVVFEDPFRLGVTTDGITLSFDESIELSVGARSHHKHPAATITTTDDPEDVMTAVSYFGSALKTTTCERSYPTLRGHPPTVELGEDLHVPSVLERPETGVTLQLPPDCGSVFVASTLAYYLGASVEPGDRPRLAVDTGFTHPLDDPARGFEGEVERVLKQTFFLDCITRTEGYYPVTLHERTQIEDEVDLDFEWLYDQPLTRQLEAYLQVPYSSIEPHVPQWKLTAHVETAAEYVEMLPFVVEDLATIRRADGNVTTTSVDPVTAEGSERGGTFTRGSSIRATDSVSSPPLIELEDTESLEQTWIGDGMPLGASKAMADAFYNRLSREPADGDIDITVVCNDRAMEGEHDVADEVYGSREQLPFDVSLYRELTTDELRSVLREKTDFFHYIGHIEPDGFECPDGRLDASTLERTGVDAFFLNACTSYQQGMKLIEAGSSAGVVTLQDVINSGAERIGETFARLLNQGFPLRAALDIAKSESIMGGHYLVVGDGNVDIAQHESGTPILLKTKSHDNHYITKIIAYPTSNKGIGSIFIPYIGSNKEHFINSGNLNRFHTSKKELIEFLEMGNSPLILDGELKWKDQIRYDVL